jgi:hypothetical protein
LELGGVAFEAAGVEVEQVVGGERGVPVVEHGLPRPRRIDEVEFEPLELLLINL